MLLFLIIAVIAVGDEVRYLFFHGDGRYKWNRILGRWWFSNVMKARRRGSKEVCRSLILRRACGEESFIKFGVFHRHDLTSIDIPD